MDRLSDRLHPAGGDEYDAAECQAAGRFDQRQRVPSEQRNKRRRARAGPDSRMSAAAAVVKSRDAFSSKRFDASTWCCGLTFLTGQVESYRDCFGYFARQSADSARPLS